MASYNGWTNYETWRTHLEMVDGLGIAFFSSRNIDGLASELKEYVEQFIESESKGLALSLALDFTSKVNWKEIADHVIGVDELECC